jgi:hypothetical protein
MLGLLSPSIGWIVYNERYCPCNFPTRAMCRLFVARGVIAVERRAGLPPATMYGRELETPTMAELFAIVGAFGPDD